MNPASLAIEGVKVASGKESPSDLAFYILVGVAVDAYIKRTENGKMLDLIYIPEGSGIMIFTILLACGILMPIFVSMYMKNESKYSDAKWKGRYIATMVLCMFAAPSLSLILLSLITQEWFADMNTTTYLILLPLATLIVTYYFLLLCNQGLKGMIEQMKKNVKDVKDAAKDIKELKEQ